MISKREEKTKKKLIIEKSIELALGSTYWLTKHIQNRKDLSKIYVDNIIYFIVSSIYFYNFSSNK